MSHPADALTASSPENGSYAAGSEVEALVEPVHAAADGIDLIVPQVLQSVTSKGNIKHLPMFAERKKNTFTLTLDHSSGICCATASSRRSRDRLGVVLIFQRIFVVSKGTAHEINRPILLDTGLTLACKTERIVSE